MWNPRFCIACPDFVTYSVPRVRSPGTAAATAGFIAQETYIRLDFNSSFFPLKLSYGILQTTAEVPATSVQADLAILKIFLDTAELFPHEYSVALQFFQRMCDGSHIPYQARTHPGRQVAWATTVCMMASNVCGSSVWILLHVALLAHRILRWLLACGGLLPPCTVSFGGRHKY